MKFLSNPYQFPENRMPIRRPIYAAKNYISFLAAFLSSLWLRLDICGCIEELKNCILPAFNSLFFYFLV